MADTKVSTLTELAAGPAETDEVYIRDVSEAAADESKRITAVELLNPENFTELAASPATTDEVFINDGGVGKKITAANLLGAAIQNFDLSTFLLVGNGGSTGLAISANGEVTMAAQPSFNVPGAARANETGDATIYTVVWGTETEDRGGDHDGTTFTCPVAGLYRFTINCGVSALASGHTDVRVTLVGSATATSENQLNGYAILNAATTLLSVQHSVQVECSASDTITVTFQAGGGSKVVDLNVGPDGEWSGELVV